MPRAVRTLIASMFSFAIAILPVFGQQTRDQGAPPTQQKPDRETKRKMKRTLKELDSAYRQWLTEDVTYIISPEERNAVVRATFTSCNFWGELSQENEKQQPARTDSTDHSHAA